MLDWGYFEGWHLIYFWVPGIQHRTWYRMGTSECLMNGKLSERIHGKMNEWMNESFQPHRLLGKINSLLLRVMGRGKGNGMWKIRCSECSERQAGGTRSQGQNAEAVCVSPHAVWGMSGLDSKRGPASGWGLPASQGTRDGTQALVILALFSKIQLPSLLSLMIYVINKIFTQNRESMQKKI